MSSQASGFFSSPRRRRVGTDGDFTATSLPLRPLVGGSSYGDFYWDFRCGHRGQGPSPRELGVILCSVDGRLRGKQSAAWIGGGSTTRRLHRRGRAVRRKRIAGPTTPRPVTSAGGHTTTLNLNGRAQNVFQAEGLAPPVGGRLEFEK